MTIQEINKAYNRIIGSLDEKELKNAFDFLQGLIAGIREYSFQDRLNELQDTYKYMLRYRIEGAKDHRVIGTLEFQRVCTEGV